MGGTEREREKKYRGEGDREKKEEGEEDKGREEKWIARRKGGKGKEK